MFSLFRMIDTLFYSVFDPIWLCILAEPPSSSISPATLRIHASLVPALRTPALLAFPGLPIPEQLVRGEKGYQDLFLCPSYP